MVGTRPRVALSFETMVSEVTTIAPIRWCSTVTKDLLELAFTARVQHLQMPIVVVAAFARAAAFPKAGMTATLRKKRRYVFWLRDRYQH